MPNRTVRLLHVDDVEEEFILARELLSSVQGIDFVFQWAADIQSGLRMIQAASFDVCLVDYLFGTG
ncbi:hypothetical protein HC776_02155 [bacterium]|nr:hypothetical protein [bacterium]